MAWGPSGQPCDRGQKPCGWRGVDGDPSSRGQGFLPTGIMEDQEREPLVPGACAVGDAQMRPPHLEGAALGLGFWCPSREVAHLCRLGLGGAPCGLEESPVRASV